MNKKLFLFSNLFIINKINCVDNNLDYSKIKIFLDGIEKKEDAFKKKFIKIETEDDGPHIGIKYDKFVLNNVEIIDQDNKKIIYDHIDTDIFKPNIIKSYKEIIFNLESENKCFVLTISNKEDKNKYQSYINIPFDKIEFIFKLMNKKIENKTKNIEILKERDEKLNIKEIEDIFIRYSTNCGITYNKKTLGLDNFEEFYLTDIVDKDGNSIIDRGDTCEKILEKIKKLKDDKSKNKRDIKFICKKIDKLKFSKEIWHKEYILFHINFDDISEDLISKSLFGKTAAGNELASHLYYSNEFFIKKNLKEKLDKDIIKYYKLLGKIPYIEFTLNNKIFKVDDFKNMILSEITKSITNDFKNLSFDINNFFTKDSLKILKIEPYLNNKESKVEVGNNEEFFSNDVFVELKAEDLVKIYSVFSKLYSKSENITIKIESTDKNLNGKTLKFENHELLSDYLKENIFCQKNFEFIKDINNYKVIYKNVEYEPGKHIDFNPSECNEVIFKILETNEEIAKKKKDEEDKKKALITDIKTKLENLKSSITDEMISNDLRAKLNNIINSQIIEDQDCKNLINEINLKIDEKLQKELKSTNNELEKQRLINDALNDLLNNSKDKTYEELQSKLDNILPNGYNPDEENKKLINKVKFEISKKNNKKDKGKKTEGEKVEENNKNNNKIGYSGRYKKK